MGRPIAYSGDPFSPALQPEERRIVLRRIANRESARRVRAKRQDELEQLRLRVSPMCTVRVRQLRSQAYRCVYEGAWPGM